MNRRLALLVAALLVKTAGSAVAAEVRVFDTRLGVIASPEQAFDAATQADVVFVGEQHGDKAAHRFQLQLLQALAARGRPAVLVMEMFERDVQPHIDAYLDGRIDEAQMLRLTRPWSNYRQDYRPLVAFARSQGWAVVAANAPRALAARVGQEGLAALDALPDSDRRLAARDLQCGESAYREKFMAALSDMGGHGRPGAAANLDRLFESQCLKDETMAESAAGRLAPGVTVVHINGSFHSDEGLGAVERLVRRAPNARTLVVSIAPGAAPPPSRVALGDFVVWTPGSRDAPP